jgi:hypothetical protein
MRALRVAALLLTVPALFLAVGGFALWLEYRRRGYDAAGAWRLARRALQI